MNTVTGDLRVDGSGFGPQIPGDKREIDFLHRASGELLSQVAVCFVVSRDDQATTRVFVEPVHDSRAFFAADP